MEFEEGPTATISHALVGEIVLSDETDLAEQLREAMRESEWSVNQISKGAGIAQSRLNDFYGVQKSLSLENASKLAAFFGMRLTKPKHKPKPKRKKRN